MIRTFTAAEVSSIYGVPLGTVYRDASIDKWRRSDDGKWPVLYNGEDVETTMERRIDKLQADIVRLTRERNGYRSEINELRKVAIAAMVWRDARRTLVDLRRAKHVRESVEAADRSLADAVNAFVPPWEQMRPDSPKIAT